ncbi:MAG: nitrate- and nitrite sensing domain-containing protein [Polyangiaceae bacterium]
MFSVFRKIAFKLAILAGVPVIGMLLLSAELAIDARDRTRAAEAIGSIEDLAELSARMTMTVDELQTERASAALALGWHAAGPAREKEQQVANASLLTQGATTDATATGLDSFLRDRDLTRLPDSLQDTLRQARTSLTRTRAARQQVPSGGTSIAQLLDYYDSADDALIDATAALRRLSNDGEMLRALSSLVAIMRVKECASREHAVLSHTFAAGEFAPGMYRYLVNLITEQSVHSVSLRGFATAKQLAAYQHAEAGEASGRAAVMVERALQATEDSPNVDAHEWFEVQLAKVRDLASIEKQYAQGVRDVAQRKLAQARRALRYGLSFVAGVLALSLALAFIIGRRITRSVLSLAGVAHKVQKNRDFSLRAGKTSADELGALADAFNDMLTVIQERDQELRAHRQNLEQTVLERTAELSQRDQELQLARKLEGVGQLAAGVAHEINTPMQYVGDNITFLARAFDKLSEHLNDARAAVSPNGAASLAEARQNIDDSNSRLKLSFLTKNVPKALHDASAGIAHVSNIVRAMKSFAHLDGDEKTNGDLNQALQDTLVVSQNEYKSCAAVETNLGTIPAILCFPGRLNQVFLNLIVNAAHAIAEAKRESGKIGVTSSAENGVITISISDNGLGIPEHIQHKIFDPFFTTKPVGKGTGQGLAISRSIIVDAHGGTLSFETELGSGTTFTIRLPVDGQSRLAIAS